MNRRQKITAIISGMATVLTVVVLFWVIVLHGNGQVLGVKIGAENNELEVDYLDVGQGDAILIKAPGGQNILIDGGPNSRVVERLSENLAPWDRKIDLMVLTHPHDDHVSGLVNILDRFEVGKILYTGVSHDSPNYLAWLSKIKEKKLPIMIIDKAQTVDLGLGCRLEILYPLESFLNKEVENLNNTSIVIKLVYNKESFLFTGDAEVEEEKKLLASGTGLASDVLKAGHHGSDTSSGQEFLDKVAPDTAVILVGKDNNFGHPSRRTMNRMEREKINYLRTDELGTIKIISDGNKIEVRR